MYQLIIQPNFKTCICIMNIFNHVVYICRPYTYFAFLCVFLVGFCLQACSGCASAHMRDIGFEPTLIANALSIHSLVLAGAKMLTGISFDKFGLRVTLLICNVCSVIALLLLEFMSTDSAVLPYIYSVVIAFGLPLETVMLPLIASDLYGQKDYSRLMGIFVSVNTMGYFFGSPAINLVYDKMGSYRPAFYAGIAVMVVAAVGMQIVITASHKQRAAMETAQENKEEF